MRVVDQLSRQSRSHTGRRKRYEDSALTLVVCFAMWLLRVRALRDGPEMGVRRRRWRWILHLPGCERLRAARRRPRSPPVSPAAPGSPTTASGSGVASFATTINWATCELNGGGHVRLRSRPAPTRCITTFCGTRRRTAPGSARLSRSAPASRFTRAPGAQVAYQPLEQFRAADARLRT